MRPVCAISPPLPCHQYTKNCDNILDAIVSLARMEGLLKSVVEGRCRVRCGLQLPQGRPLTTSIGQEEDERDEYVLSNVLLEDYVVDEGERKEDAVPVVSNKIGDILELEPDVEERTADIDIVDFETFVLETVRRHAEPVLDSTPVESMEEAKPNNLNDTKPMEVQKKKGNGACSGALREQEAYESEFPRLDCSSKPNGSTHGQPNVNGGLESLPVEAPEPTKRKSRRRIAPTMVAKIDKDVNFLDPAKNGTKTPLHVREGGSVDVLVE